MLRSLSLFVLVASAIALAWYGMGRPAEMPPSPLGPGERLTCISYAPFHGDQAPYTWDLHIPDSQIGADLKRLSALTSCVRTYSAKGAQGQITRLAARQGLKVLQGVWLGRNRADNRREIESALKLARRYPGTVQALIVGSETLLRGELAPATVAAYLEEVKKRSGLPVTYADVWEFWLKSPELAASADFITIHILPYWEDEPVSVDQAVAHVTEVRDRVKAAFPGKEIWVGEVGWPSKGRMREGALPSPVNQAGFLSGVVSAAKEAGWKVNLIEAFDQPWKRLMEGTVGGYWGVYDDRKREPKFSFGAPVSNHPDWRLKAGLGIGAAFLVFLSAWVGSAAAAHERSWRRNATVALIALGAGLGFGLAVVNLPMEGETASDRLRSVAMVVLALVVPMAASYAVARGDRLAGFAEALDSSYWRRDRVVAAVLAALLAATVVAAIHVALGLVFDPRYKDFPFAALAGPVIALAVCAFTPARAPLKPGAAEIAAAAVLTGSALFIIANEGIANWQALLLATLLLILALTTLRSRAYRAAEGRARLSTSSASASAEARVL
ncbi:MAG TPA: beta-1,6-glucan synthase [Methyloceanibacter sp.]|jgi:glucan 1,3-beta-glucosidase|nr:beta-1,6-glucan synthase [Methyloceanibacter sp.]